MTSIAPKNKQNLATKTTLNVSQSPQIVTQKKTAFGQWFDNLSIRKKQLTALFASEFIAVIGLMGVGSFLILTNGRTQLVNQVKSEIIVTLINYNIKIDQMGFGFRGQSDNLAIINAAKIYNQTGSIPVNLETQVREILQNEIKAREIEYATLVSKNQQIIINANYKRTGETFDPHNLVSQVIINPQQIKTSEIVKWSDLQKEKPPLPPDFSPTDALIRYTVTPVRDRDTREVLGVLVSGDIINNKYPIVQKTIDAFGSGYSAIYQVSSNQKIQLAVSNFKPTNRKEITKNIDLENKNILQEAIKNPEEIVSKRVKIDNQDYTLAAKLIKNYDGQPVAILVKGTEENLVNQLLKDSISLQLLIAGIAIVVNIIIALILGKAIANPVESLRKTTEQFSDGNLGIRTKVFTKDELGELASTFNQMADSIESNELRRLREEEETRLLTKVNNYQILSETDLENALNDVLPEIRNYLNIDRLVIFQVTSGETLKLIAEGVNLGIDNLKNSYSHLSLPRQLMIAYQKGLLLVKNQFNLIKSGFYAEHLQLMQQLEVTTNMVLPIVTKGEIYGLLMAQSSDQNVPWNDDNLNFLKRLSQQFSLIIERFKFIQEQQLAEQKQKQEKEQLQQRALNLLKEVDPVSRGDLTIRAQVTLDEIGTIADSYNSTIESLRRLVTQVKNSAEQVANTTLGQDEIVNRLGSDIQIQSQNISAVIEKFNKINESIYLIALNAASAEVATQKNMVMVKSGDEAMNRTVEGILSIKETVDQTTKQVQKLEDSSKKISKVVNLINKFAAQTHLLALKASIEAARAGEQGQGFAVIADEVRSLAAQSAEATEQIELIVGEIQNETKNLVIGMKTGTEKVETGTKLVEEAREKLTQILHITSKTNQLIESISASIQEQSQDSETMNENMIQVEVISQITSLSVLQVLEAFSKIRNVSQNLQQIVAKFKVN
jgi:twitching motility protein PilJ